MFLIYCVYIYINNYKYILYIHHYMYMYITHMYIHNYIYIYCKTETIDCRPRLRLLWWKISASKWTQGARSLTSFRSCRLTGERTTKWNFPGRRCEDGKSVLKCSNIISNISSKCVYIFLCWHRWTQTSLQLAGYLHGKLVMGMEFWFILFFKEYS